MQCHFISCSFNNYEIGIQTGTPRLSLNLKDKESKHLCNKNSKHIFNKRWIFFQELVEPWMDLNYRNSFVSQANFSVGHTWPLTRKLLLRYPFEWLYPGKRMDIRWRDKLFDTDQFNGWCLLRYPFEWLYPGKRMGIRRQDKLFETDQFNGWMDAFNWTEWTAEQMQYFFERLSRTGEWMQIFCKGLDSRSKKKW